MLCGIDDELFDAENCFLESLIPKGGRNWKSSVFAIDVNIVRNGMRQKVKASLDANAEIYTRQYGHAICIHLSNHF